MAGELTISERINGLLVDHLCLDTGSTADSGKSLGDLGADSLDIIELEMAFEEEFGIKVESDLTIASTPAEIAALVESRKA